MSKIQKDNTDPKQSPIHKSDHFKPDPALAGDCLITEEEKAIQEAQLPSPDISAWIVLRLDDDITQIVDQETLEMLDADWDGAKATGTGGQGTRGT